MSPQVGAAHGLPALTREIGDELSENNKVLASRPSLDVLRRLSLQWSQLGRTLSAWQPQLTSEGSRLDREMEQLARLTRVWEETLKQDSSSQVLLPDLQLAHDRTDVAPTPPPEAMFEGLARPRWSSSSWSGRRKESAGTCAAS